jgi:hypothetical protein
MNPEQEAVTDLPWRPGKLEIYFPLIPHKTRGNLQG